MDRAATRGLTRPGDDGVETEAGSLHRAGCAADPQTEEATKNAFVMPFISLVLGYDVFNPAEVIPEFTADVGVKRGEKVAYALLHGGQVQILVEAKKVNDPLRIEQSSQPFRYFAVTNARVAVLTNGEVYEFYTDLDAPNKMNDKLFLVLDLAAVDPTLLPELAKLTRESFDLDSVINAAEELKYIGQIRRALAAEFRNPRAEWVKLFTSRVYGKSVTASLWFNRAKKYPGVFDENKVESPAADRQPAGHLQPRRHPAEDRRPLRLPVEQGRRTRDGRPRVRRVRATYRTGV